ncbi:MAG: hypothetical protein CVV41_12725 [Candidatus Riflebacteria bacterium HGW-Riflebacteria-1]|jgi:glutaminase|nr:MAG: hypothetical protein CVV41_12725 [Candidatus Riflebacteria bacterium HGW-Riflebacteria-1]
MSIRNFFARFFSDTPEKKIKKLLKQLDQAMADLQIRIADSIARSNGMTRNRNEETARLEAISPDDDSGREALATRIESISSALEFEQKAEARMRQIYEDLKNRQQQLQLSYQQSLTRLRNAEVSNLLASIHKDFGSDMQLNNYLEKFSEESFKIEFTADSRLKIEMMLDKAGKL